MKIAHILLVHKQPHLVARIIKAMAHRDFYFFLHVDKKCDISSFLKVCSLENVSFVEERINVKWGGFSIVEATLASIRSVLKHPGKFDVINLMSGQDYPIKSVAEISGYYASHPGMNFITYVPSDSTWWKEARVRVERYHMTDYSFKGNTRLANLLDFVLPKRTLPFKYELHGGRGSGWWSITYEFAQYLVSYLDQNPRVRRFMKHTWAPDEFLIQTILMNSPFRQFVINKSLWYMKWPQNGPNPEILCAADFADLLATDQLYARKFDIEKDETILNLIDEKILAVHRAH